MVVVIKQAFFYISSNRYKMKRFAQGVFFLGGPLYYVHLYHFSIGFVKGDSMAPTFNPDRSDFSRDCVLLEKNPVSIQPGDIVFFRYPLDRRKLLVKRVVAVQGQSILPRSSATRHPSLYENNQAWIPISEGHCWVESDEPYVGIDSNQFGPIPTALVESKVTALILPFDRMQWLTRSLPDSTRVK
jgi:inner membrane protease subunit 2